LHRKIYILGGPGSGKTYGASSLSEMTGILHFPLDDLFWDPDSWVYVRTPLEIRDARLDEILKRESWIIEGAYASKWVRKCFHKADIIFFLNPSVFRRHFNILKRFVNFKLGRLRHNHEQTFLSLLELVNYNRKYNREEAPEILQVLSEQSEKLRIVKSHDELIRVMRMAQ
jgi:adenylate kinase family enzyme